MAIRLQPACIVAIAALVAWGHGPALGQSSPSPSAAPPGPIERGHNQRLVHVNPVSGSDGNGDGSQLRPYQTITQALAAAPPQSIVVLASGEYSADSGETFPLRLKPGVTVQGAPGVDRPPAVIRGSGLWTSRNQGSLHVTVIGVDGAGLGNVTLTNPHTAGYGMVVEAGRPVIRDNLFVSSGYGGALVTGDSAPLLEGNRFTHNGVVGLAIAGQSTAQVQGNQFDNTGIGIRVAPGAQPEIHNNRIVQNQDGIILDGSAQPYLHNNHIAHNRRNGVVEFQVAAKADESGPAIAAPPVLHSPAPTSTPTAPPVVSEPSPPDSSSAPAPAGPQGLAPTASATEPLPPSPQPRPAQATAPLAEPITHAPDPDDTALARVAAEPPTAPSPPAPEPSTAAQGDDAATLAIAPPAAEPNDSEPLTAAAPASIPESLPLSATGEAPEVTAPEPPQQQPSVSQNATANRDRLAAIHHRLRQQRQNSPNQATAASEPEPEPESVPLQVIPPPAEPVVVAANSEVKPETNSSSSPQEADNPQLLRVPSGSIPSNYSGDAPTPRSTPGQVAAPSQGGPPPPPPSLAGLLGLHYKVLVPAADQAVQDQVRALVSDAFRVRMNGQWMMQAGAYPDSDTAAATADRLRAQGLPAQVDYVP
ncbi:DUF1565 domain-containing protein [Nodosilinea sp. P-1105]|uniref:DUF1565 domain-containing protein n=1 Tax=Nodosilinea sp. P-1105 TaxID=2546229 RepID=UPI00146EF97A|nr:DUF1565 domain-containing protein [Nodosilinea sp. P-1105]NMF83582.1 DUF1565 domain-containing protein [Nodosilinea sp. P-1105]